MLNIFIGSLSTKKNNNGGERQKSSLMYKELLRLDSNIICINLEHNRFLSLLKLVFICIFKKKQIGSIIISKFAKGGITIHKILLYLHVDFSIVTFFLVGSRLIQYINQKNYKYLKRDKAIVVESFSLKNELLLNYPELNVEVLTNFKEIYDLELSETNYPKKQLKLVFFSRLLIDKGILDLIYSLSKINNNDPVFLLDIYGPESEDSTEKQLIKNTILENKSFCCYKGNLPMPCYNSYRLLSEYDLHVFPTRFPEGVPGTLIDCFISGIPTLSSSFPRASDLLDDKNSYIFKQFDCGDLIKKLVYVYNHQEELPIKRKNSYEKRRFYSTQIFVNYIKDNNIIKI